ncbi:hypothetical protein AWN76_005275 [Rhodothermaceae bacterium RA]|nr:hypothetical protein AWN76_005275 [Rhodothermaceae bacterium RA]
MTHPMPISSTEGMLLGPLDARLQLDLQHAQDLLKGVRIPPRSTVLVKVLDEQARPEPDIERIAELIGSDVALSAGMLKIVNSPVFGLSRRVGSIHHAVRLLGVDNVVNVVTGLMLHEAFKVRSSRFLDAFWASANRLAAASALVARRCSTEIADEAYAAGLLADCGVPVLLRRFPDTYQAVYADALRATDRSVTACEQAQLGTDHAVIGYLVSRTWKLPPLLSECILHHHDTHDYFTDPEPERAHLVTLLAVLKLAGRIQRSLDGLDPGYDWAQVGEAVMVFLGLTEEDVPELQQQVAALPV